jgi:hypothetical protein
MVTACKTNAMMAAMHEYSRRKIVASEVAPLNLPRSKNG